MTIKKKKKFIHGVTEATNEEVIRLMGELGMSRSSLIAAGLFWLKQRKGEGLLMTPMPVDDRGNPLAQNSEAVA